MKTTPHATLYNRALRLLNDSKGDEKAHKILVKAVSEIFDEPRYNVESDALKQQYIPAIPAAIPSKP